MPRKFVTDSTVHTLVLERLDVWGRCIHAQRVRQRITAIELAERMQVSRATVQRLERGDPGAAVSAYLTALLVLGVFDLAVPELESSLWSDPPRLRVKPTGAQRSRARDDDDF
ncbi:MAG: helix-turn-helix transcriptional regulator [Burkholderiaceae bacterium]